MVWVSMKMVLLSTGLVFLCLLASLASAILDMRFSLTSIPHCETRVTIPEF
jgi:hypothetical protein